ncbi:MAG: hypothetical protein LCH72_06850 [Proteobacteria bacterium]|nr:hypothetical protein [Burkholderiales bacterium]MCA0310390.1 hypothetical protein [Pseudomonadota bacterium]
MAEIIKSSILSLINGLNHHVAAQYFTDFPACIALIEDWCWGEKQGFSRKLSRFLGISDFLAWPVQGMTHG